MDRRQANSGGKGVRTDSTVESVHSIVIPLLSNDEKIEFFPDELSITGEDMVDMLRGELAPLNVWRACAVEYHRQGQTAEFTAMLLDIVESLLDDNVNKIYRGRPDYVENMTEIYHALAAKSIADIGQDKELVGTSDDPARKVVDYLKHAEMHMRMNEYSWLLKGFFELKQGEIKRAEEHFKNALDRTKGPAKKKYSFPSLVGMGIVSYLQQKYSVALDYFIKAIQCSPSSGSSIRVAVATCCYRLEQYDRARFAVERAMELDPCNVNALILLALLEQVQAKKSVGVSADHAKRLENRLNAYEYCMLVCAIDPTSSMALVHMANHCSHTWKVIAGAPGSRGGGGAGVRIVSENSIALRREDAKDVSLFDHIRLNFLPTVYTVKQMDTSTADADSVVLVFDSPIQLPQYGAGSGEHVCVEARELGRAFKLATEALALASSAELRAEAYYILGKVHHMQGRTDKALGCYRKSLGEAEFMLSAFGAAQIQLSRHELASAYDLFERVYQRYPEDKDTKAFFYLVKALHKGEMTPMEQLKDVCVGFQFEADLWTLQGQLRFNNPPEFPVALRCLTNALECLERRGESPDALLLSNMSVLQHSLGRLAPAVDFARRALIQLEQQLTSSTALPLQSNPPFRAAELDGVLYEWKAVPEALVTLGRDGRFTVNDDTVALDLAVGTVVVIGDIQHTITAVHSNTSFEAFSYVPLPVPAAPAPQVDPDTGMDIDVDESDIPLPTFSIKLKQPYHNFTDEMITLSYNFARVLEDVGSTTAATEIYVEVLKRHPAHMECYLRLSRIARDMGRFEEASLWLSRALAVNEGDPDVNICLGDLFARNHMWDEAKKIYEKICSQKYHDTRAMLSLGNFYFTTLSTRDAKYESHLKDSYKFFHHVLNEDNRNVYAANGLGMICAEKKELEVAREIFARARESNMSVSDDICINLAHVHYAQGRFMDAEHQYQATLRALHQDRHLQATSSNEKLALLCEYSAVAQFSNKRLEESLRSLLRALHVNPTNFRLWFNVAIVRSELAAQAMARPRRTVADIGVASEHLNLGQKLYLALATSTATTTKESAYDKDAARKQAQLCEANKRVYLEHLQSTLAEETARNQERRNQDEKHLEWRRAKEEKAVAAAKAVEEERFSKQQIAQEKSKRLGEMREKWVVPEPGATGKKKSGGKGKGKAAAAGSDDSDSDQDATPKENVAVNKSDIDDIFGKDDDDNDDNDNDNDADAGTRPAGSAASADTAGDGSKSTSKLAGMFGSDDEDSDAEGTSGTKRRLLDDNAGDGDQEEGSSAPATSGDANGSSHKRLRREHASDTAAGNDSDNDDLFGGSDDEDNLKEGSTSTNAGGTGAAGSYGKSRLIDDDDDEM